MAIYRFVSSRNLTISKTYIESRHLEIFFKLTEIRAAVVSSALEPSKSKYSLR
jgi:hypothetical protein